MHLSMLRRILSIIRSFDRRFLNQSLVNAYALTSWFILNVRLENLGQGLIVQTLNSRRSRYLHELCQKHGTDKGSLVNLIRPWPEHTFADIYTELFADHRFEIVRIFEMGIGTNNLSIPANMSGYGKPGASLRVWKEYFPNALVVGADIDRNTLFEEERILTFFVDQLRANSITKFWNELGIKDFDIIIDDGLHTEEAAICLFENSFNNLRSGGFYFIEDVTARRLKSLSSYFQLQGITFSVYSSYRSLHSVGDNTLIMILKP